MNKTCCENCRGVCGNKTEDHLQFCDGTKCLKGQNCPCHSKSQEERVSFCPNCGGLAAEHQLHCPLNHSNFVPKSEAQEESWEEEFGKLYKQLGLHLGYKKKEQIVKLKSFISDTIKETRTYEAVKCCEHEKKAREEGFNLGSKTKGDRGRVMYQRGLMEGRQAAYQEVREVIAGRKIKPASNDYQSTKTNIENAGYNAALSNLDAAVERLAANDKTV